MNDYFEMIYENGEASHLICKECGVRVERGIVNVSGHWCDCTGKTFKQNLFKMMEDKGKITMDDLNELRSKFL